MNIIDIIVMIVMAIGVTWLGHLLSGNIKNRASFFQADGSLPWWAVSSSIIATVVSSVTFVSVPAAIFSVGGYLLFFLVFFGLLLGYVLVAMLFVNPFYNSAGIETTYDYIRKRIDLRVGDFAMYLGLSLTLVNTSVKLLTTGLVLSVISGWGLAYCCMAVIAFSILWSWLAGIKTVIWTDFLLFIVFLVGAIFAIIWTVLLVDMSIPDALRMLDAEAKLVLFDFSTDPKTTYTIWAGIFGSLATNIALASAQGTFQRVKACRSEKEAKKAYMFSAVFYFVHLLIMGVGLAMTVFYTVNPLPADISNLLIEQPDRIFPYFIINEIPVGITGVFIAAIFAAGISSLDSALAEAADITISNIYERKINPGKSDAHYLLASRIALCIWGVLFFILAIYFSRFTSEGLLNLTFKLPNYLFGAMFGTIILARYRIGTFSSYLVGLAACFIIVWFLQDAGVSFFWWSPVSGLAFVAITWILCRSKPELTGIIKPH
jgi:SSS family transporter